MFSQQPGAPRASRALTAVAVALSLAGATAAHAEAPYPNRPIRMVLPSGAGTVTDQTARLIAERLSTALRQPVVIDNRPGANGIIASETVARAAPDGYTLLFTYSATLTVNPWTTPSLPYDPVKDFTPIARPSAPGGNLLAVSSSVPVHNLQEFLVYVKASKSELAHPPAPHSLQDRDPVQQRPGGRPRDHRHHRFGLVDSASEVRPYPRHCRLRPRAAAAHA